MVSYDRRFEHYIKRVEAALPAVQFQPHYDALKCVVAHVTDQLRAMQSFDYGSVDNTTKSIGARSIMPSDIKRAVCFEIAQRWWSSQSMLPAQPQAASVSNLKLLNSRVS